MTGNRTTLKKRFFAAMIALLIAFVSVSAATFAWYIYNTNAHTTTVRMAAGSASSLLISNTYDGEYTYSVPLAESKGELIPVSTDKIQNGFQHVKEFEDRPGSTPSYVATIFEDAQETEYYLHTLYLKSTGDDLGIYVSDIGYEDSREDNPISSAIRVGFKVYKPGSQTEVDNEYIFEINPDTHIANPEYNTSTGKQGYVLNSSTKDNTTIKFTPYTPKNYCEVDSETGDVILKEDSLKIATCTNEVPVRVDVYIWLEGCDEDCTLSLRATNLKEVAVKFAGKSNS